MTGRRYPLRNLSAESTHSLAQWIGCARVVYNAKDDEERYFKWLRRYAKFSARAPQFEEDENTFVFDQAYSHLKGDRVTTPWMFNVPPEIYRNAMYQRAQAWQRHWENPAQVRAPGRRRKGETDSILLTKELFQFWGAGLILVGNAKYFVGVIEYHEHRPCGEPNSITLSRDKAGRWWVSFAFEDGVVAATDKELLAELDDMTTEQIAAVTVGHDRGITQQVTGSDGSVYGYTKAKEKRFAKYQRRIKALQKKLARQTNKGSTRRRKTKHKLAVTHASVGNLRNDHAHQISHLLVSTPAKVLAFEELKLRGMTRSAMGTVAKPGSNVRAKAGLNRELLHQSLGKILRFVRYKGARNGKLIVTVPAANSSRECRPCGHTEKDNRRGTQFHCLKCGHTAHADANASEIIQKRGVTAVLTALGRSAEQPCAEATSNRTQVRPGASEARRCPHAA